MELNIKILKTILIKFFIDGLFYIVMKPKHKVITGASLDRKDSSVGYTKNNIQWVHKAINRLKTDFNQKKFIELCHLVSNFNN